MRDICHYSHDMPTMKNKRGFMEKLLELISLVRQKYAKVNGMFAHQQQKKKPGNIQYAINNSNKKI